MPLETDPSATPGCAPSDPTAELRQLLTIGQQFLDDLIEELEIDPVETTLDIVRYAADGSRTLIRQYKLDDWLKRVDAALDADRSTEADVGLAAARARL